MPTPYGPPAHLVFSARDPDRLVDAFLRGVQAHGVRVTRVAQTDAAFTEAPPDCVWGGFSKGARIAVSAASRRAPAGLLLVGFPFHPKGQPEDLSSLRRLEAVEVETLVLQGERDAHGNRQRIRTVPPHISLTWLRDGNHRLQPRKASGTTEARLIDEAARAAAAFVLARCG